MLFLCGRWARHCYITSLLTLHWSINNRPIQVANNRPIYVVGCTWSSNTCKVLYFWFGGQNDLLRTMWYFIIQLILHLYNILGLVSGKIDPEIMDREFEKKWSKKNLFIFSIKKLSKAWGPHKCHRNRNPQVRSWDNGPRIWKEMVQKKLIFFSIEKLSKAWGPHKCHRNRNPQVRCWDNGPRIWKKMVQKKLIFFFYRKIV